MVLQQRSYQRWLDERIYKTEIKFWAVLGSRGCREKKPPNCHKYATFGGGVFNFFCTKRNRFRKILKIYFAHKKLKKPPEKVGRFFFFAATTAQNSPELYFRFINSFILPFPWNLQPTSSLFLFSAILILLCL